MLSVMRSRFVLPSMMALAALAGCDTGGDPAAQGGAGDPAAATSAGGEAGAGEDVTFVTADGERATLTRAHAGTPMPPGRFAALDGSEVDLATLRGRPVLVNLWATWCAPCVKELPTLDRLAQRQGGRLTVLPISLDLEGMDRVRPWWSGRGFTTLTTLADPDNRTLTTLGANVALPSTILYDAAGREVWRVTGGTDWSDATVTEVIAESL